MNNNEAPRCETTNKQGTQCRFVKGHPGSHGYNTKYNKELRGVK